MMQRPSEILLSQRFFPEFGGSIRWFYELFSRRTQKLHIICDEYADSSAPDSLAGPQIPDTFRLIRAAVLQDDWGLDTLRNCRKYWRLFLLALVEAHGGKRIYAARLVPEGLCAVLAARISGGGKKVICFAHGEEILACQSSRQLELFLRFVAKRVDLVLANSENTAELLAPYCPAGVVEVLHPGVDTEAFYPLAPEAKSALRRAHQIPEQARVLLTLARLDARKNHRAVLQALARLLPEFPGLYYMIVGDGPMRSEMEKLVIELQLGDSVLFLGAVSDQLRQECFQISDLFVMPSIASTSDTEGFGLVFLEAAASGLPSVAGIAGGQQEAVAEGESGFVVDGSDIDALQERIRFCLEDPARTAQLGQKARAFAQTQTWERKVAQFEDILQNRKL